MNRLIVVGASGHGKVVADVAVLNGYKHIVFVDDNSAIETCAGFPVVGDESVISRLDGELFVAIGNNATRRRIMERFDERTFPTLIHPRAVVANDALVGVGTVVMAGSVVNPSARIGAGVIINTNSVVEHDCVVSDYCHVSVGACLCGTVGVGAETFIGAGAVVRNNTYICGSCVVGMGTVVVKDLKTPGTYVGNPARQIR